MKTRVLEVGDYLGMPEGAPRPGIKGAAPTIAARLAFNTAVVGGAFVLSRVLGLVREAVIASRFGTSGQYDAYVAAFRIPDTLFLLIIGGAVGSAFIPVFTGLTRSDKEREAWQLASTLINASVVLLSLGGLLLGFFAPALVATIIAPAMPPDRQDLVVNLTRVMLLSPLFMGLGGWAMGILNARQHFALPALAPIAYNLAIIAGALFLVPTMGVYGLAVGVVAGSLLHVGLQVPGLVGAGMRYSLRLNVHDAGVGEVARLLVPRMFGQAAFQANIIAMTAIATTLPAGRLSAFNYAYMLMILPHGVFAMSLATVTFPGMAAQVADGDLAALRTGLSRAVKVLLFLIIPSAVGLFLLRYELVATLFQLGKFTETSTQLVASTLGFFALGLVAYAVVEVVTRAFYALHDTVTPVAVSVAVVLVNLGLSMMLVLRLGWDQRGLALSLALTTTVEMILLWTLLGRKLPGWRLSAGGLLSSIARSSIAAAAMAIVVAVLVPALHALLPATPVSKVETAAVTLVAIGVGALSYLAAARLLRSEELDDALRLVLRRSRR